MWCTVLQCVAVCCGVLQSIKPSEGASVRVNEACHIVNEACHIMNKSCHI